MEEIYILTNSMIVAADPMDERDFAFSKGQSWNEEEPNRAGYRVRCVDGSILWRDKEHFEASGRKMTLQEAEMVAGGQFVIPDSSGSTIKVA
jgi:hypothetical protein